MASTHLIAFQYSELNRVGNLIQVNRLYDVRYIIRNKGYHCFDLANSMKSSLACSASVFETNLCIFRILLSRICFKKIIKIKLRSGDLTGNSANTEALFACSSSDIALFSSCVDETAIF